MICIVGHISNPVSVAILLIWICDKRTVIQDIYNPVSVRIIGCVHWNRLELYRCSVIFRYNNVRLNHRDGLCRFSIVGVDVYYLHLIDVVFVVIHGFLKVRLLDKDQIIVLFKLNFPVFIGSCFKRLYSK